MSINISKENISTNTNTDEDSSVEFEISYGSTGYSYQRNKPPFPYPSECLASMWQRLVAYFFDSIFFAILGSLVLLSASFPMHSSNAPTASSDFIWGFVGFGGGSILSQLISFMGIVALLLCINLFSTFFIFATNGFTPGKWLMGIRIVTLSGEKITFWDAFLRESLMKCLFNALTSNLLNVISFIWGCFNEDHKTIHDLAAKTTVVNKNLLAR